MMDIDYVIAWVDGQDPSHLAARQKYAPDKRKVHFEATTTERYQNNGEIYYHIASIIKYAPFIRSIVIASDNQKPEWINSFFDEGKCAPSFIRFVSHDELFAGLPAIRPSFNARSIESCLWRIPDLAEHFVYANDDFFINAPITPDDFFDHGLPVLFGDWREPDDQKLKYRLRRFLEKISPYRYRLPNHGLSQWKGAALAGAKERYFSVAHYPHPLRRSTLEQFFATHRNELEHQVRYRFRDIAQFNIVALANQLEISYYHAPIVAAKDIAYVDFIKPKKVAREMDKIKSGIAPYGCVQGFERFSPEMRNSLHLLLIEKFADVLPKKIKTNLAAQGNA